MEGMEASFSIMGMWEAMTWIGKAVVIILALMSIWSLTIAIERLWRFQKAKKQSLDLALKVTPLLKQHKLGDAISLAKDKKYRHSHLARVLSAGLTEFEYETSQALPPDFDNDGRLDLFVVNYVKWDPTAEKFCGDTARRIRSYCHPRFYEPLPNRL